jgi:flagellar hook assembly protein FlgD
MRSIIPALALLLAPFPTGAGLSSGQTNSAVYAFPNPARTSTTIRFQAELSPIQADITIYDIAGNLVREISGGQIQLQADQLTYHAPWDLTNSRGQAVASGVYLVMVKVNDGTGNPLAKVVKKVAVIR